VTGIVVMARLTQSIATSLVGGMAAWRLARARGEPPELSASPEEFVTIATYDKALDAHIALGRLSAEGIEARLFDENMVQVAGAIALGGIKLRVTREDEKLARKVLETDYSGTLEGADLGKRED